LPSQPRSCDRTALDDVAPLVGGIGASEVR